MENIVEQIIEQGILYDFYGPLLTDHQQKIYEAVVYENLSLGEVGQEYGISRQAVHDLIKRCDKILRNYEDKLGLIKRFEGSKKRLSEIKALTDELEIEAPETAHRVNELVDTLLEEW